MGEKVLQDLFEVIRERKTADPEKSYTAKLFAKGREKIAQKVGEEAIETVIAGVRSDLDGVVSESADLLYHLLVLWADTNVMPDQVWDCLKEREGTSGIEEKNSRKE